MKFEYKQPTMKDSLYGKMYWEDFDYVGDWFSHVDDDVNGEHEVHIAAESQSEFMAVRNSHTVYKRLLADLPNIRRKTVLELLENEELGFAKNKHKKFAVEKIEKTLKLHSIKIYYDASAKIAFDSEMLGEDSDEFIFAYVEPDGELAEADIDFY